MKDFLVIQLSRKIELKNNANSVCLLLEEERVQDIWGKINSGIKYKELM